MELAGIESWIFYILTHKKYLGLPHCNFSLLYDMASVTVWKFQVS